MEDIGRHNTLDKAIGYASLNGIETKDIFMVSTGRMSSEMVTKICRAGIPLVATKTAVTDKGLETGKKCGMTLIGFVRDVGTKINTDMEVREFTKAEMKYDSRRGKSDLRYNKTNPKVSIWPKKQSKKKSRR